EDCLAGRTEDARRALEALAGLSPRGQTLRALCRVRQVLSNWPASIRLDAADLTAVLELPLEQPRLEADRHFARGWLSWLIDQTADAARLLARSVEAYAALDATAEHTEAAYWLARVQRLLGRNEVVAAYEKVLRLRGVAPRATCWFVDLLWRAGQPDRAE